MAWMACMEGWMPRVTYMLWGKVGVDTTTIHNQPHTQPPTTQSHTQPTIHNTNHPYTTTHTTTNHTITHTHPYTITHNQPTDRPYTTTHTHPTAHTTNQPYHTQPHTHDPPTTHHHSVIAPPPGVECAGTIVGSSWPEDPLTNGDTPGAKSDGFSVNAVADPYASLLSSPAWRVWGTMA